MTCQTPYSQQATKVWIVMVTIAAVVLYSAAAAIAGCGCEKPAPRPAAVRPDVTWAGMPVSFFGSNLVAGESYRVTFTAMDGTTATATGTAETARDFADAVEKPQLRVVLPELPLGPAGIVVRSLTTSAKVLTIADGTFTVAPQPIALPGEYGSWS